MLSSAPSSRTASGRPVNFYSAMALLLLGAWATPPAMAAEASWTTAWGVAPLRSPIEANIQLPHPPRNVAVAGQTVREFLTVGASGTQFRLHLDNRYGQAPVEIAAATVARIDRTGRIGAATLQRVAVQGKDAITLPAQGGVDTDALPLPVHAGDRLAVSLYIPGRVEPASWHVDSRAAQQLSAAGDHTADAALANPIQAQGYDWLTRVDVLTAAPTPVIVALGDSITNGFRSSVGASYPEQLARRLTEAGCDTPVINMGIDGNQAAAGLGNFGQGDPMWQRLAADVLSVNGAKYLLLLGGINDIGEPSMAAHAAGKPQPGAEALAEPVIAALQRIAEDAKQHGLTVYGATLPPFGGTQGAFTPQGEAARQAINRWIRHAKVYQGVADFDAALRDNAQAERMQPALDSGDHIHPNDRGYRAMAESVPLAWFGCRAGSSSTSRKSFKRTGAAGE